MLLHEAEGHTVVVELKNGEIYRGLLTDAEDTMNCQLKEGQTDELVRCPAFKSEANIPISVTQ